MSLQTVRSRTGNGTAPWAATVRYMVRAACSGEPGPDSVLERFVVGGAYSS